MKRLPPRFWREAVRFAIVCRLAAALPQGLAQLPAEPENRPVEDPEKLEVVSIHPHRFAGDEPSDRRVLPGGRFVATATSVRTLIRIAFGTDDDRISGAPGWTDTETFDIEATTADHADVETSQQFQRVILRLLEDRFQLKYHRERKEGNIYWLEVEKPGRAGPGLKANAAESRQTLSMNRRGGTVVMEGAKTSMNDLAAALRRSAGRPVEDHTGLDGEFDFHIEWAPDETQDSASPSLETVLRERLGLRLRPAKGIVERLVIDRIERPSAN